MKFNFGTEVTVLPASVLSFMDAADAASLRVLLWLASDVSLAQKEAQLARLAGVKPDEVRRAIAFWCEQGVLTRDAEGTGNKVQKTKKKEAATADASEQTLPAARVLERAIELPNYTSTELADILEKRESFRLLLVEAQNIVGRVFNTADTNVLVGLSDHLGMSDESILTFLSHCRRIEKTQMRAIERYAIKLADRGISTPEALEEEFCAVEAMRTLEGKVRAMFGMKSRSLTKKEEAFLRAWNEYGYGEEIISVAYELTVNATGEASLPYANSILKRWHEEGLDTLERIRESLEKRETDAGAESSPILGNSFDTDAIFEAALSRSFSERREN